MGNNLNEKSCFKLVPINKVLSCFTCLYNFIFGKKKYFHNLLTFPIIKKSKLHFSCLISYKKKNTKMALKVIHKKEKNEIKQTLFFKTLKNAF